MTQPTTFDAASRCTALMNRVSVAFQGIVNVSPDSFSDGGMFCDANSSLRQALALVDQGAHIIDLGGVSTRPGAQSISTDEELRRVIPALRLIRSQLPSAVLVSLDTSNPIVAEEAAKENLIDIVNDVFAAQKQISVDQSATNQTESEVKKTTAHIAAKYKLGLILMHMQGIPTTMQLNPNYVDCIDEVVKFLRERMEFALECGVTWLALDPGIGFGKTLEHNICLLSKEGIKNLSLLGAPVLIGLSRKSFLKTHANSIGSLPKLDSTYEDIKWRDEASKIWEQSCIRAGARIIRTHVIKSYN